MSDFSRKRFFLDGIMLTAVALAMRTVAMFFGAFVSRTVGAEGTGVYTLIMTVYSFAVTFATSGISLTVTRLVATALGEKRGGDVSKILRGAFLYSGLFGLVATAVLFFGAEMIGTAFLSDTRTVISLKVLAFSLIPAAFISVLSGYFVGVKRVGFNAVTQVLGQGIKIVTTVILVLGMSKYGVVGSVAALCIGITLTETLSFVLIFLGFLYDRHRHGKRGERGSEVKEVARTAMPLALSAYVRSAFLTVEHMLIPKKLRESGDTPAEAYAHYGTLHGMALPVVTYPMTPLSSFAGLLVPEFAEELAKGNARRMSRIATAAIARTLTYASVIAVMLYSFSEELGYVIYGSYDAGYYVSLLAPVIPIMYLDHVTDSMLKGIGEQVYAMWVNITDSLLSVILVWLLIPRMGIAGYAVVIVVMEAYNFVLSFVRLRSRVAFDVRVVSSVVLPLVTALLSTTVTRTLFHYNGSVTTPFWLVMKMVFAVSVYVAVSTAASTVFHLLKAKKTLSEEK